MTYQAGHSTMKPWTLLIVDDNPDDRLDIKAALRNGLLRSVSAGV